MADVIAFMILVYCYNFCQPESENMICKLIKVFFYHLNNTFVSKCVPCGMYVHLSCLQIKRVEKNKKFVCTLKNFFPFFYQ